MLDQGALSAACQLLDPSGAAAVSAATAAATLTANDDDSDKSGTGSTTATTTTGGGVSAAQRSMLDAAASEHEGSRSVPLVRREEGKKEREEKGLGKEHYWARILMKENESKCYTRKSLCPLSIQPTRQAINHPTNPIPTVTTTTVLNGVRPLGYIHVPLGVAAGRRRPVWRSGPGGGRSSHSVDGRRRASRGVMGEEKRWWKK